MARIRCQRQIAPPDQTQLIVVLDIFRRQRLRQTQHPLAITLAIVHGIGQHLGDGHAVQHIEQLGQHAAPVGALLGQMANRVQHRATVTVQQGLEYIVDLAMIEGPEHGAHIGGQYLALAKGDRLVGQAHGVTHGAIGRTTQQPERIVLEGNAFRGEHLLQVGDDPLRRHVLQRELQAAREDGDRQLLRIGGGEQELDVGRWLFQRLEQGIEAVGGEHVHLVDEVHLVATAGRRVLHVLQQLAGVFHLGAAGGVHFDEIDEAAFVDLAAHRAAATGRGADAGLAIQALGQDPRDGGLAHPAGTGEQIGVVQPLVVQRIDQRLEHMGLADHFAE